MVWTHARRAAAWVLLSVPAWVPTEVRGQSDEGRWTVSPAQVEAARNAPLLGTDAVLEMTLAADFNTIRRRDRSPGAELRPAKLTYSAPASEVELDLQVQTRGNWRLDPAHCSFPPLWLDFERGDPHLRGTAFEGQNRLKLYVTCRPGQPEYEQDILNEYVIYPAFNALTAVSFRARPARVTYVDSSGRDETFTSNAFLLEHKDQMAARKGAVPIDVPQLHPGAADQEQAALMEVFQYMVGMTDWNAVYMHNVEPIRRMDGRMLVVSYDFDWSGTVSARYATPNPALPIRSVRERLFQGFCREVDYGAVFARFLEEREAMLDVVRRFAPLEERRRNRVIDYWEGFFEMIRDPGKQSRIVRGCTRMPS